MFDEEGEGGESALVRRWFCRWLCLVLVVLMSGDALGLRVRTICRVWAEEGLAIERRAVMAKARQLVCLLLPVCLSVRERTRWMPCHSICAFVVSFDEILPAIVPDLLCT